MKLSLKIFCIAYTVVLLSVSVGGIFLVNVATDALWDARAQRVSVAQGYAADSFLSFADVSSDGVSARRIPVITRQIKSVVDGCISAVKVTPLDEAGADYAALEDGNGFSRYYRDEAGAVIMESVCRLNVGSHVYFVSTYSDFSEVEAYCRRLWNGYGVVTLGVAVVGGLLLFWLAAHITRPIKRLTRAAQDIASGNYGETVSVSGADGEITELAESFNVMSAEVDTRIRQIREEMEKRNTFVADFTHEMKTPVTAMMGYAQLLDSYELDEAERRQAAQAIYSEAKRLEKLSRQMLDLVVYRHEGAALQPVALADVQAQLETVMRFPSEKYGVACRAALPDVTVEADPVLLLSLLYNLVDNALKASPPGETVTVTGEAAPAGVTVRVEDHGRGIAPENLSRITEPFFREDKARSRAMGGAGLGLSLCREIAALHGTQLRFDSEPGRGTAVSFDLRRAGDRDEDR